MLSKLFCFSRRFSTRGLFDVEWSDLVLLEELHEQRKVWTCCQDIVRTSCFIDHHLVDFLPNMVSCKFLVTCSRKEQNLEAIWPQYSNSENFVKILSTFVVEDFEGKGLVRIWGWFLGDNFEGLDESVLFFLFYSCE